MPPIRWVYRYPEGGVPDFRVGRSGGDVIAEWVGQMTLRANLAGTRSEVSFEPGVDQHAVETSLHAKITALIGHLRGQMSLHASSVARTGVAIAFMGESCAGKSTVAAQLCLDHDVEFLSDDLTFLNSTDHHVEVMPADDTHFLREDVARALGLDPRGASKTRLTAPRASTQPSRLCALVALVFDDAVERPVLRRVRGSRPFVALNRALVRFVIDEPDILRRDMDRMARVADEVPFYELVRSRNLANLPATAHEAALLLHSLGDKGLGA